MRNRQEDRAPDCSITVIDPYAHRSLELLPDVTIMRQRLEDTDYPIVEELEEGDFLFIDSEGTPVIGPVVMRVGVGCSSAR